MQRIKNLILDNKLLKFIIVGGCSTGIDFLIYMVLSVKIFPSMSKGISMIAASVFSYFANKTFTFKNREKTNTGYLIRFYLVFAFNFVANVYTNHLVLEFTGLKVLAFVVATVSGMTVNYLGQKFFVFNKK